MKLSITFPLTLLSFWLGSTHTHPGSGKLATSMIPSIEIVNSSHAALPPLTVAAAPAAFADDGTKDIVSVMATTASPAANAAPRAPRAGLAPVPTSAAGVWCRPRIANRLISPSSLAHRQGLPLRYASGGYRRHACTETGLTGR